RRHDRERLSTTRAGVRWMAWPTSGSYPAWEPDGHGRRAASDRGEPELLPAAAFSQQSDVVGLTFRGRLDDHRRLRLGAHGNEFVRVDLTGADVGVPVPRRAESIS